MPIQADLRHVIYSLSDALDLVGVDDIGHGKRVGIMAAECGRSRGLSESEVTFLFDLGLLHDIGVSSTAAHSQIVREFNWAGSQEHCEIGWALLEGFPPLEPLALPVRYHHTPWERLLAAGIDPAVAWRANLIYLVDRADALAAPYQAGGTVLMHHAEIRDQIAQHAGSLFAPELVDLFLGVSRSEAFWLLLEPRSIQTFVQDMLSQGPSFRAIKEDLRELAQIFSRIVDAKSPFTAEHSMGVAGVARLLAEKWGLDEDSCAKIEIAGLLHDVGKLRVPDEILDKPGGLDVRERQIINTHSFETYQILRHIKGFEEITPWAAYHHEEPGGKGYPFHLEGATLPIEARLLRAADIFQAMVQTRPYRKGLSREEALAFMQGFVDKGRLEAGILELLASCGDEAMLAARAGDGAAAGRSGES